MSATAEDWDARVTRLSERLPERLRKGVDWLREPSRRPLRLIAAILLMLGGVFSILPVLGLWMLPLGLALLAQDVPALKAPMERAAQWIERRCARVVAWWSARRG